MIDIDQILTDAAEAVTAEMPKDTSAQWRSRLDAFKAWKEVSGKWPSMNSVDLDERSFAQWRNKQLRLPAGSDRRATLDNEVPGWVRSQSRWDEAFAALLDWSADHDGATPRVGASGDEGPHATFLRHNRLHPDRVTAEQRALLDVAYPGWWKTQHDKWIEELDGFCVWFDENGKTFPRRSVKGTEEFRWNRWLEGLRRRTNDPKKLELLDARVPGWRESGSVAERITTPDLTWMLGFNATSDWVDEHGALPRSNGDDTDESLHGNWLRLQRRLADGECAELLDERLPGWRTGRASSPRWHMFVANVEATAAWLEQNPGRTPTYSEPSVEGRAAHQFLTRLRHASDNYSEKALALADKRLPGWRTTRQS